MVGGIVLEPHQDFIRFIQMDSIAMATAHPMSTSSIEMRT